MFACASNTALLLTKLCLAHGGGGTASENPEQVGGTPGSVQGSGAGTNLVVQKLKKFHFACRTDFS